MDNIMSPPSIACAAGSRSNGSQCGRGSAHDGTNLQVGSLTFLVGTAVFDMATMMPAAMMFAQTLASIGSV